MIDNPAIAESGAAPALSVIVVIGDERERAEEVLGSLLEQSAIERMEILLFDLAQGDAPPFKGCEHPAVRFFREGGSMTFHEARVRGVESARAPIVAFIEEHCLAFENWSSAIIRAFATQPWAGVGYEVHNGNPDVGISNATFLMNYVPWSPPVQRGEAELIPGHNAAYRREVLFSYGERLPGILVNDMVMQRRLRQDGHRLGMEPDARIAHINEASLGLMGKGHYYFNRCLAAARATELSMPAWRKALFVATSPLRPWLRYGDNLLLVLRHRPRQFWRFLAYAPVTIASFHYSVAGLVMGYLFGAGDAPQKISDHELTVERPRAAG